MNETTCLHPPLSQAKVTRHPEIDGEYLVNIAGVIRIAKDGETPKARALYRAFCAEFRALEGRLITDEAREQAAFKAAAESMGWRFAPHNNL